VWKKSRFGRRVLDEPMDRFMAVNNVDHVALLRAMDRWHIPRA
jgi:hypothetical protein